MDRDEGKVSLTLRPSDLRRSEPDSDETSQAILSAFQTYISERDFILGQLKLASEGRREGGETAVPSSLSSLAAAFVPGGRISGHVTSVLDDMATVELEGTTGQIRKASLHGLL